MHWFSAKRQGFGWGLPTAWQGWIVLGAFVGLFGLGFLIFPPSRELGSLLVYAGLLTGSLMAICWFKGEPLR